MKKVFIGASLMLAVVASALSVPTTIGASAQTTKSADVWIVAGQSNAAGYSKLDQTVKGQDTTSYTYKTLLTEKDERNSSGYSNVLYYGTTGVYATASMPAVTLRPTKMGMGDGNNYVGPELGMANVLSQSYTDNTPAVIMKYAVGGTYLCDFEGSGSQTQDYGNWASPSMTAKATEEGIKLHANNGLLYERLLSLVTKGLEELTSQGYTPSIKGYIWMQGEADAGTSRLSSRYEENLKLFINDLRSDIAKISNDADAVNRPFVIGKINSSGSYGSYIETVRTAEDNVASLLSYVYTIETNDFNIKDQGSDSYHFNAADMFELGKRFATTAMNNLAKYTYHVTAGTGGSVGTSVFLSDGEAFELTYTAERGKILTKVLLNDEDITASCLSNGIVNMKPTTETASFNEVALEFSDATAYKLTVNVGAGGKIERSPSGTVVYIGDQLVVNPKPSYGYQTNEVIFNGEKISASEDGKYYMTITGDSELSVTFTQESASTEDDQDEKTEASGCGGTISGGVISFAALAATSVVLLKKKHG